ncbi:S8 family serine peptidase [Spirosoma validum]|uniref:S8 family serine peptidase n=1 Tax=Spirosoma validum TaxID=2771355 RepID=A0A927AYJ4_9BACT|nr:S8 family serine peptidase [Spirosoma validum]MBD2752224.1 S8 family serine peptidase [Spirosoma validum]
MIQRNLGATSIFTQNPLLTMTDLYAFLSVSTRFTLLVTCLLISILSFNSQAQNKSSQTISGQYIIVYKPNASVKAIQSYQQRQQLMREVATATLLRNRLSDRQVLQVYDTALQGFSVGGLTGAEVDQLRQDDQIAYIVPDRPVFLSEQSTPQLRPLAGTCYGPSVTINGVTNYAIGLASFGSTATASGEVILVNDGTAPVTDGCGNIQNNIAGKIALIDRGICDYSSKAYAAQLAGAIGVIIVNNVAGTAPGMAAGTSANLVTIPVMSISLSDGNALKTRLTNGTVTAILEQAVDPNSQCKPWGVTRVGGGLSGVGKRAWIIDSGIDLTHPDLNVNTTLSTYFIGNSPADGNGHGTHVAGTIAAKDNGIGVIGVAAGAEVVAVRVFSDQGSTTNSIVLAGVNYVAAHAASGDVVNMSLGGDPSQADEDAAANLSAVCRVVVAAGNEAKNANFVSPARINGPNIFTVSAMDINDKLASFSNFGNGPIDYSAPGVNVASCWLNGGYSYLSGTSMAAPHVAGLLLLGTICATSRVTGDPDGNPDLIATLYNPANDVDNDHDGVTVCGGDCNDNDPAIHPGAVEICDNKDNNCDGQIDESDVCCSAGNTRLYVNASATGVNNGFSWQNAFTSLQAALASANRCSQITQIWVAKGTYYPTADELGNASPLDIRTKSFSLKNNLAIYGGFAGNEAPGYDVSQRNFGTNLTTLSGDIQQDNVATNNVYNVVLNVPPSGTSITSTAVLDGFTIQNGYANFITGTDLSFPRSFGGGMFNYSSGPTIRNCSFEKNGAYYGGGMENQSSNPTLLNCSFVGNNATILIAGAGVDNDFSSPTLTNCSFQGNTGSYGGGVANFNGSSPTLTNSSFSGNRATTAGGSLYNSNGSAPAIKNTILWGNSTEVINAPASATLAASNPTITYSIVQGGWSGAGANNLNVDPKFVSQPAVSQTTPGDLRLTACSPAINAGDPTTTSATVGITDLAGAPRFVNNGRIDIGAYEFQGVTIAATPSLTISQGTSTTLTASGATSFIWSTGVSTASIVAAPTSTTAYSVTGTTGGCSSVASVTVTVIPVPDLIPLIYFRPTTLYGTNDVTVVVDVVEILGTATSGLITVRLTKDSRMTLSYPPTATSVNNRSVQNSSWTFESNSNPNYYIFTSTTPVSAGDKLSFGLTGVLTAGSSTGIVTLSSVILGTSGGEVRVNNNVDADKIDYFQQ